MCRCSGTFNYPYQDNSDCYDLNNYVWPGQSWVFLGHRGDGSYDYDCDGVERAEFEHVMDCDCDLFDITAPNGRPGWASLPPCGSDGWYITWCTYFLVEIFFVDVCIDSNPIYSAQGLRTNWCN